MAGLVGFLLLGVAVLMTGIGAIAVARWWYTPELGSLSADPEVVAREAVESVLVLGGVWELAGNGVVVLVVLVAWCVWRGLSWPRIPFLGREGS